MTNPLDSSISYLDRVKAQSEVLIPLLNRLRQELGTERANALVYGALRDWSKESFARAAGKKKGSGYQKWLALDQDLAALTGDDIAYETLQENSEKLDLNVTVCRFAQLFKELGEPELGAILTCEVDHHLSANSDQEVQLDIDRTLMKGDDVCNFRYRFSRKKQ